MNTDKNIRFNQNNRLHSSFRVARSYDPVVIWMWFIVCLFFIFPSSIWAFSIEAQVDRRQLSMNDQLTYQIIVSDDKSQNLPQPDLPGEFDGFSVLTGPNRSTSIQIVNFKMNSTATYSYILAPLKKGTFTFAPVSIVFEGKKYSTKAVSVEVTDTPAQSRQQSDRGQQPQSSAGDSFFRLELSEKEPYVGQQVLLEYVLYTRERIVDLGFKELPTLTGFWVEEIDMKQIQQTETTIEGVPYNRAVLKRQLLFPTSIGEFTIEPVILNLQVAVQQTRRRSRSLFDDFFNDPFFNTRSQTKYETSQPVTITVKPLPNEGKPESFNGLVGEYQARASLKKSSVKLGDSVTYTITISGSGNIQSIPEPNIPEISGAKLYSPTVDKKVSKNISGVKGSKTFEYIIVPREEGELFIPSLSIPYFSPKDGTYKTARIDQMSMTVLPSDEPQESPLIVLPPTTEKSEVTLLGQDINYIKLQTSSLHNHTGYLIKSIWFWFIQLIPICLIGLISFVQWRQQKLRKDVAGTRYRRAGSVGRKYLKEATKALKNGDVSLFYQVLGTGLSEYLADKLNISAMGMTSEQIKVLLIERNVPETLLKQIIAVLEQCDYARFAPSSLSADDMKKDLDQAKTAINNLERHKLKKQ